MGRPKGEKSTKQIKREEEISDGMIYKWIKQYNEDGIGALQNKRKPGNPLTKYSNRKQINIIEQLEYEIVLNLSGEFNIKSL